MEQVEEPTFEELNQPVIVNQDYKWETVCIWHLYLLTKHTRIHKWFKHPNINL